jgi:hypothetical protein
MVLQPSSFQPLRALHVPPSFKVVLVSRQSAVLSVNLERQLIYTDLCYTLAGTFLYAFDLLYAQHGQSRVDVP